MKELKEFRDHLLDASDRMESAAAPPRLAEMRDMLRKALRKAERAGIPEETAAAALLSEALPRLIACYVPSPRPSTSATSTATAFPMSRSSTPWSRWSTPQT